MCPATGAAMTTLKFTYRSGQRPLDGFTLKRGVGQGGFGEVYFAVSDGGKEVALKLLRGHTDAELRGIGHCLNLKHANLVHLYDLRSDARGEKWVVMEYVFGESLAQVINRHPSGLPAELIREWFGALCRGVGYLHDQGVVHRDLKPANIFLEHGHLKVGDYGLSRRMSSSERGELTRGVGTPHYMAPEIKNGNYGRSVDVYACGVILFEMLTGQPPFDGETAAEVLMKHQLDAPDLTKVPAAVRPVLDRALQKDPAKRFATVLELARAVDAVYGGERSDASATVTHVPLIDPKVSAADTVVDERLRLPIHVKGLAPKVAPRVETFRGRLAELVGGLAVAPVVCAACTAPWALLQSANSWSLLGRIFLLATAATWLVVLLGRFPGRSDRNTWGRRALQLIGGAGLGVLAFWLDGWALPTGTGTASSRDLVLWTGHRLTPEAFSIGVRYVFYFALAMAAARWWVATDRDRRERVRVFPVAAATFWATVFLFLWPWESSAAVAGVAPLVIAAIAAQVVGPWRVPDEKARSGGGFGRVLMIGGFLGVLALVGCNRPAPPPGGAQNSRAELARSRAEALSVTVAAGAAGGPPAKGVQFVSVQRPPLGRPAPPAPKPAAQRPAFRSGALPAIKAHVASTLPYPAETDADEDALTVAADTVQRRLAELDPPVAYRPTTTEVKNEFVRRDTRTVHGPDANERAELEQNKIDPNRVYVEYDVEVSADQVRDLRTRERVIDGTRFLGLLAATAVAGFLFLRLDEWTGGYLTRWLAIGALALACGAAVGLYLL